MGYELYISRRKAGSQITSDEWSEYVAQHGELVPEPENGVHFVLCSDLGESEWAWLDWFDGKIHSKNPEPALINKMVKIAADFDAVVVGEEGELYRSGDEDPEPPTPSLWERLSSVLARLLPKRKVETELPDFSVGDKVVDPWGNIATVTDIDVKANHGAGRIRTRWTNGETRSYFFFGHGLEKHTDES